MEDGGKFVTKEVNPHPAESIGSVNTADSTSNPSPNELSPDSTSEVGNSHSKTERLDSYIASSKVNGDCIEECSVPTQSPPPNNNSTSAFKKSSERNTYKEKTSVDNIDESSKCDSQKKDRFPSQVDVDSRDKGQPKNLSFSQEKTEHSLHQMVVRAVADDLHCENISNVNEVTSTLEDKHTYEANNASCISIKTEFKSATKNKRPSMESSYKTNDPFKPPSRYDLKSSKVKLTESTGLECGQKQNDPPCKSSEKINRNNKRKSEDKHLSASDLDLNDSEKFPIQYKGFKKKASNIYEKNEKRINLKWNPFNPACKQNRKSNKCLPSRLPIGDEIDCSALQQSEYAQYLGLQPILKFRCSNCGSSAFQSMVALNTHQIECTKSGKGKFDKSPPYLSNPMNEPKSTNIKLTRKVFLCSACGTYYEHWNLFLHMREVHRRYICLYCLGMFSIAEKLSEHLIQKHKITHQNFNNLEDFQKHSYQTFFMLCLNCDKVFSEIDDFYGHVCNANKKTVDSIDSSKSDATSSQESSTLPTVDTASNVSSNKPSTKRTREASKRSTITAKSPHTKKDEPVNGNGVLKLEDSGTAENKEEPIKPCDISTNKSVDTTIGGTNERIHDEPSSGNLNEIDTKPSLEQNPKPPESNVIAENLTSLEKTKPAKKGKSLPKKAAAKRKKPKEKEEENDVSAPKIKKTSDEEPAKESSSTTLDENKCLLPVSETENIAEVKEDTAQVPTQALVQQSNIDISEESKKEMEVAPEEVKTPIVAEEELSEAIKEESSTTTVNAGIVESKNKLQTNLLKFKLPGLESEGESDDSQKLSLIVDENASNDAENKIFIKGGENSATESDVPELKNVEQTKATDNHASSEGGIHDIILASEDVAVMALTLDDKIENIAIQTVLKECVRTSCMSCNYCRHAVKIAVNGRQLALHILSEHRYMPIKNETPEDVINKLKTSLTILETMFFNTETYDNSDPSIHVPYDQDSSFDCFQCNYVTSTHRDLFAHKRKSHTKSLLLCIMCKSNFYSYSELLCHLCPGTYNAEVQFHNIDINFRCCFCRLDTIPSAFRLMVHLRKTHHTCDICLENGVDQQKLATHMWKHKLNHLCYRCGIAYASKPDITKHLFWKHGHESVLCKKCLQKKWPHVYHFCIPPNSFICEECNANFSKAVALKVHKRIHGDDFPYTCTECNKKFVSKKLLQRHEERHVAIKNNIQQNELRQEDDEQKEEIINVSDVINENKEPSSAADLSDSKEMEPKDKSHKKHKRDKDKKDKQVVDVYDLPPLNLSSESDSSDEDNNINDNCAVGGNLIVEYKDSNSAADVSHSKEEDSEDKSHNKEVETEKLVSLENKELVSSSMGFTQNEDPTNRETEKTNNSNNINVTSPKELLSQGNGSVCANIEPEHSEIKDINPQVNNVELGKPANASVKLDETKSNEITEPDQVLSENAPRNEEINIREVQDIWKNFYSKNPTNSKLPYPLCAAESELVLGIVLGDHDYCYQPIEPPAVREEPSTSGLSLSSITDHLDEGIEPALEKITEVMVLKDITGTTSPVSSPKKKPKSPKKKNSKGENENNSSSSSDSSSESSSSSCSCGPNCSCSSSSSNSSSSSSSDTESSAGEDGTKQERKRKKRDRRNKTKSDHEPEIPKEQVQPQTEKSLSLEPVDPPIRESELETDETTTDEEFYDQQPQRIANQLLAEKRNQLMLLASAANVNNGNSSPSPIVDVLQPEIASPSKQKIKTKRKRKMIAKGKPSSEKNVSNSHPYTQYAKDNDPITKHVPQYHANPLPTAETKLSTQFVTQTPTLTETTGSGSETEKSRSSKRRRIPNKFYGYSSGDEEEKPAPSPKWRKQETTNQPSRMQQPPHPPTPRIQLTVPKQVIRKPYKLQKPVPKTQLSSSDSTDSGNEMENQKPSQGPPINQEPSAATTSQKNDKDVYCYCRCPYDEVSEMIACDDENCEIEWFHFECVGISVPPRGQWFCPGCRKARGLPT